MNGGVLPAGVHQGQSGTVSYVVIGDIELLQRVVLEPASQLQGPLVTEASVHKGQVRQSSVLWESLYQREDSRLLQRVVTQPAATKEFDSQARRLWNFNGSL